MFENVNKMPISSSNMIKNPNLLDQVYIVSTEEKLLTWLLRRALSLATLFTWYTLLLLLM